jgi:hypothetical protein
MAEPAVRPSTGPLYVDPDAVLLGALKLENELARGGLLPRPTTAVQEILRAVQSANAAMREPSEATTTPAPAESWPASWTATGARSRSCADD